MSYLTKENVLDTHPVYDQYIGRWRYLYASFNGGFEYRKPRLEMLRRYLNEDQAPGNQYQNRLNYTALENACKLVTDTYRSFLFRTLPARTLGNLQPLPFSQDFIDDIDLDGTDIDAFMKDCNTYAMVYGHVWVLVDKPIVEGVQTLEQEIAMGIRPYAQIVTPEAVLDWNYERILGRYELTYLKMREAEDDETVTLRVWHQDVITRYKYFKDAEHGQSNMQIIEEIPNTIGKIPFELLKANHTNMRGVGMSDITDVAKIQQSIFNLLSEAEAAIRVGSHPSLVNTASTDASAGAGSIITMDENTDPNLKPYLLSPAGTPIDSIVKMLQEHQKMIAKMTHLEAVMAEKTVAKSGVALQTEMAMLNTRLGDKADALEQFEYKLWELFQMWTGIEADDQFTIEYRKKFDIRDENNDLANYKTVLEMNIPSETLNKELYKQISKIVLRNAEKMDDVVRDIEGGEMDHPVTDEINRVPHIMRMIDEGFTDERMLEIHPEISQEDIDEARKQMGDA